MITAKDIRISSHYISSEKMTCLSAQVMLRADSYVSDREKEWPHYDTGPAEQRLKREVLNKVYGEILHTLKRELYELKFKMMELPWDPQGITLTPHHATQLADEAYQKVIRLIDEKMKVD